MSKIALRKAWFQVHKWIGLTLAVLIIPLSLTGSALVWDEPIQRMLHPELQASGPAALPATAYVDAARAALRSGEIVSRLDMPGGEAVTVTAIRAGKGMPQRATVYLDPANARVLGVERSGAGIFRVFHNLHGQLLVPGVGRAIVGWIGVAMLLSSLTGLWLWWPLSGSVDARIPLGNGTATPTPTYTICSASGLGAAVRAVADGGVDRRAPDGARAGRRAQAAAGGVPLATVETPVATVVEHA
ncbi:MAG: PepSY-associated TM helix domain-containing protein [Sphingomonas sp.]